MPHCRDDPPQQSGSTYGAPRVHAELRAIGIRCGKKRVARLMRRASLRGCLRGRRMRITHRLALQQKAAPDLVGRNFATEAPDKLWVADITYVRSKEGFVYLAFILDACSRRVVGWSMAAHLRTDLALWTLCRWQSRGASHLRGLCTTRTVRIWAGANGRLGPHSDRLPVWMPFPG